MSIAITGALLALTAINSSRGSGGFDQLLANVEPWHLKALFVTGLIGMGWGAWYGKQVDYGLAVLAGVVSFFLAPLLLIFAVGILRGIYWLFT